MKTFGVLEKVTEECKKTIKFSRDNKYEDKWSHAENLVVEAELVATLGNCVEIQDGISPTVTSQVDTVSSQKNKRTVRRNSHHNC